MSGVVRKQRGASRRKASRGEAIARTALRRKPSVRGGAPAHASAPEPPGTPDGPILERPAWLPPRAQLVVLERNEASIRGEARLKSRPLARLLWTSDGELGRVHPLDRNGKPHGLEVERLGGRVVWCASWRHGKQHGLVMQFDDDGQPLFVTEFDAGRGTDIWMGCGGGCEVSEVSEVRDILDSRLHGWVRWGDPARPSEEEHYRHGERHGIFRTWSDDKLCDGFPRFYLDDKQVSRRDYEIARARDASLPPYDERDDSNRRPVPPVVHQALARAKELRREMAFLEQVRRLGVVQRTARRR